MNDDSGPAFPRLTFEYNENDPDAAFPFVPTSYSGMSLRDYFAGQAMIATIADLGDTKEAAERAWAHADAMLKAREK